MPDKTPKDEGSLWETLRSGSPDAIKSAVFNPALTEEMAIFIARSRSAPPEALGFLASDRRFKASYELKLSLSKNPKTPQRVVLSLLKFLKIFDLADLTRDQRLHIVLRQKIEQSLSERIPSLPSGIRSALAKRASSNVVMILMQAGERNVVEACLNSPYLREADIYKAINRADARPILVRAVATHPKWSLRYSIKFALIRNFYTPMADSIKFIKQMKTPDLKALYRDPKLPSSTRPFIYKELAERGIEAEMPDEEEIFDIEEEDDGR